MKATSLLRLTSIALFVVCAVAGCSSSSDDEGGKSTATPASKQNRPGPGSDAGPAKTTTPDAGTLPEPGK